MRKATPFLHFSKHMLYIWGNWHKMRHHFTGIQKQKKLKKMKLTGTLVVTKKYSFKVILPVDSNNPLHDYKLFINEEDIDRNNYLRNAIKAEIRPIIEDFFKRHSL